ncbi:MAG: S8 family peptidase [Janthinobacterium lividum]
METPPPTPHFTAAILHQSVITMPLRQQLQEEQNRLAKPDQPPGEGAAPVPAAVPQLFSVIIDLNLEYPGKRAGALHWVVKTLNELVPRLSVVAAHKAWGLNANLSPKNQYSQQYLFVEAEGAVIQELVRLDQQRDTPAPAAGSTHRVGQRAIYHIWSDFELTPHVNKSISTIKGDAAQAAYSAYGEGIVWAVIDSGIDYTHPHFATYDTLKLELPLVHTDFTAPPPPVEPDPETQQSPDPAQLTALTDAFGHGTHVAGIIAGSWGGKEEPRAYNRQRNEVGDITYVPVHTTAISGIASKCKLLSLKVLDSNGKGNVSNLLGALAMIQELNGYGRRLLVHGVNLSVGYEFKPEWFACGQSPLCVEVNRLVRSGVVVVVAAGNTGYGTVQTQFEGVKSSGVGLTINDPGNADLAITVGATHREMPHVYGVSYFSSKGPTGDGRVKPDLVAPGERILSCAAGRARQDPDADTPSPDRDYVEDTGTSMAAPHVSGAVAAFLSIRREFIGRPEQVKDIFLNSATDLKREKYFQGSGLVDLMRAIQSV